MDVWGASMAGRDLARFARPPRSRCPPSEEREIPIAGMQG
jgi:hypothetical protein